MATERIHLGKWPMVPNSQNLITSLNIKVIQTIFKKSYHQKNSYDMYKVIPTASCIENWLVHLCKLIFNSIPYNLLKKEMPRYNFRLKYTFVYKTWSKLGFRPSNWSSCSVHEKFLMYQFPSLHPSTIKDMFRTDRDVARGEERRVRR